MSAQALSDDQVAQELKKMTAFIKQEAMEKAREIQLKADEEFAIEKSKLVRQETQSIDQEYEKKFKQAAMSQQITRSTSANKTRLRVLQARQELLEQLFEEARKKIADKSKDKSYDEILKGLVLEGMYMLCEPKVGIKCKKSDRDKVKKAADAAAKEYKQHTGADVESVIDEQDWLPEESAGGVFITGSAGKIEVNNTLEERLRMCETEALPVARRTLFGENENRKFTT